MNLSELVTRTLHLHAYSLRKSNITVDFLPEESLPQITGDPHQLMQVFLNLMLNAEQAIREARDKGTLRIRAAQDRWPHSGGVRGRWSRYRTGNPAQHF